MKKGMDYIGVAVGAMIFNEKKELFLSKRGKKARNEKGCWEIPGGSVEFGETLQQAIKREMLEEYGVEIDILEQFPAADHLIPKEKQHWVPTSFLAKIKNGQKPRIKEPDKCDAIGFFPLNQLPRPLSIITEIDIEHYKNIQLNHKYEYFISSRLRNRDIILDLLKKLRAKGKVVYYFMETDTYHSQEADPEYTMKEFESTPDWRNNKMVRDIFEKDMQALRDSEKIILLLPAGKSAHIEAGAAYGLGKRCIVIGEQKEAESLYLIFNEHYPTIDAFIKTLD